MDILDKYLHKSAELLEQGKTGYECEYCGNDEFVVKPHYGNCCKGCGVPLGRVYGTVFGVPVYLVNDWLEILRDPRISDYRLPMRRRE